MLTNRVKGDKILTLNQNKLVGFLLSVAVFILLFKGILAANFAGLEWINQDKTSKVGLKGFGLNLMTEYVLAFEMIGVLLLIALIGAVCIAGQKERRIMPLDFILFLGALLFCSGLYVVITKRNSIMVLIGVELMLNAANVNLIAFSAFDPVELQGQIFSLFVITVAAAEAAVALALVVKVYEYFKSSDLDEINELRVDVTPRHIDHSK